MIIKITLVTITMNVIMITILIIVIIIIIYKSTRNRGLMKKKRFDIEIMVKKGRRGSGIRK